MHGADLGPSCLVSLCRFPATWEGGGTICQWFPLLGINVRTESNWVLIESCTLVNTTRLEACACGCRCTPRPHA